MVTRNIVLLPPPNVAQQAMVWSRKIASAYKTDFVLDGKQFYPHITLYQTAYPDKNLPKVEKTLEVYVRNIKPFKVHAEEFSTLMGFIFLNAVKSPALFNYHKQIVSLCNPFREGNIIPSDKNLLTVPDVADDIKHSIRLYGSALAMNTYVPHITITRLQRLNEVKQVISTLENTDISFEVRSLFIANIGMDGTVNEIFKEFPFEMI